MYPILFKIGKLTVHTYGFFVAVGFLTGISLAKKEAARLNESPDQMTDLCFYILIAAIVMSRIFYILTLPQAFLKDPVEIIRIWNGGLVFYGGFIGAFLTVIGYVKKHQMSLWKITDILAPPLAVGHFFGRVGCFFAGCCYGKECNLPWAITFTHPDSLAPIGVSLHPTQIYEAITNLAVFTFLWGFRKHKTFDGQVFWIYVMIYGTARSMLEAFRNDYRGGFLLDIFSLSQVIGISFAVIAGIMLWRLSRRRSSEPENRKPSAFQIKKIV